MIHLDDEKCLNTFPEPVTATIILCKPNASRIRPAFCEADCGAPNPITVKNRFFICKICVEIRRVQALKMSPVKNERNIKHF